MQQQPKDPDAALVVTFRHDAVRNEAKTIAAGRPVFDDREVVDIRFPGRRDFQTHPATEFSDWVYDQFTGEQVKRTYAERFAHQYRQFKSHVAQTKQGTPLDLVPFLTVARRAELRALNVYTVEALAAIDGEDLKHLGQGGRDNKNKAMEFIAEAAARVPDMKMQVELEALRARNQVLEEDNKVMASKISAEVSGDEMLDGMSDTQLKDFIAANTGNRPIGNPARRNLLRMAMEARPGKVPA